MEHLYPALAVVLCIVGLIYGAARFVAGASGLATTMGMSPMIIGMVVVGLGTSAPELLVSTTAALQGDAGLAIGNAIGSNIANLGLVLAVGALVAPLLIPEIAGRKEIPRLLVTTGLAAALLYDGDLSRFDGVALILALVSMMVVLIRSVRREERARGGPARSPASEPGEAPEGRADSRMKSGAAVLMGLVLLLAGSKSIVWGATDIARALGVSDFVIGLTVVAIGTSLPELASTIFAARRGEAELVVGNIVGSNTFNTLAVLGVPGVISPVTAVSPSLLPVDLPVMLLLTAMLGAVGWRARQRGEARVGRRWGVALLTVLVCHAVWTAMSAAAGG